MSNDKKQPWEAYPDVWSTKSKFFTWLQHNIHREVFCGIECNNIELSTISDFKDISTFISKAMFVRPDREFGHRSKLPGLTYWLHIEGHLDPCTEGYIGVTHDLDKRVLQHRAQCLSVKPHHRKHTDMVSAFINDAVIVDTLFYGEYRECLEVEFKMRPLPHIGWNLAVGGDGGTPVHGLTDTPVSKCFYNLRNKALKNFVEFGWEGNIVGFSEFYKATKPEGTANRFLTRKDPLEGYTEGNLVWLCRVDMLRNTAKSGRIKEVGDVKGTISELSKIFNMKPNTISCRLRRGWSIEEAVGAKERRKV